MGHIVSNYSAIDIQILVLFYYTFCSLHTFNDKMKHLKISYFGTEEPSIFNYSRARIIRTFCLICTIVIHTNVYFPMDSTDFDIWIIRTFCLICTKFSRIFVRIIRAPVNLHSFVSLSLNCNLIISKDNFKNSKLRTEFEIWKRIA